MFADCNTIDNARKLFSINSATSVDAIHILYKNFALKYHPDRYSDAIGKELCKEAFQAINTAYELLTKTTQNGRVFPHSFNVSCCQTESPSSCCQTSSSEEKEETQSKKRRRVSVEDVLKSPDTYSLNKWYVKDWKVKYLIPNFVQLSSQEIRNKGQGSRINLNFYAEETLTINLPTMDEPFCTTIQTTLNELIPTEYGSFKDKDKIIVNLPKHRKDIYTKLLYMIIKLYKLPVKLEMFLLTLLNRKEFDLRPF